MFFFFMSVYLQREPVHRNDTEMVPVILFTEKNCLHIIHKSFYKAAFVVFVFFCNWWSVNFHYSHMLHVVLPLKSHNIHVQCWLLTEKIILLYLMHTYTVNKILDIKLSLWQMSLKLHSKKKKEISPPKINQKKPKTNWIGILVSVPVERAGRRRSWTCVYVCLQRQVIQLKRHEFCVEKIGL